MSGHQELKRRASPGSQLEPYTQQQQQQVYGYGIHDTSSWSSAEILGRRQDFAQPLDYRALVSTGEKSTSSDRILGMQRMHEVAATADQVSYGF